MDARVRDSGSHLATLDLRSLNPSRMAWGLSNIFRNSWRPQVIQGWLYHGNLAARALAPFLPGARLAWNIRQAHHGMAMEKPLTAVVIRMGAVLSRGVDAIVCNSSKAMSQHITIGYSNATWTVIPNGFDMNQFRPDPELRRATREALGLTHDLFVVGVLARVHPMKNHHGAIQAVAKLNSRIPGLRLLLAGHGATEDNIWLKEELRQTDLYGQTLLLGERTDIPGLANALDVLLNASHLEGFPNVIGESLACGVPCVATDVGDSGVAMGEHGILVPPGNVDALGEALFSLYSLGPEARSTIGARGREHVAGRFGLDRIAGAYAALYDQLING